MLVRKGAAQWYGPCMCQDLKGNPCCRWVVCPFADSAVLLLYKTSKQVVFVHMHPSTQKYQGLLSLL